MCTNDNKKRAGRLTKVIAEDKRMESHPPTQGDESATSQQKTRRKDRPPPINILNQNPKDTTKLLQVNLKNMKNFYIKRINNGKHKHAASRHRKL